MRERLYAKDPRFDRVCVLLRKGDWKLIQSIRPEGASAWARKYISEFCDEVRARRAAARPDWRKALDDPNF